VIGMDLTVTDISGNPLKGINQGFDFTAMVPLQLENSMNSERSTLQKIKTIIVGGGTISEALNNKIVELSCEVYHTFGMTETISHIAMRNLSKKEKEYSALPNVHFRVNNDCLVIQAQDLGVNDLKTTDIVELTSSTSFTWKGRQDFVINSGGIKIHPEEVEQLLFKTISSPFFVFGLEDSKLGNKVVLCIESKETIELTKSIFTYSLDPYQIPKEIYFFETFNRTESNKINKLETIKDLSNAKKQVL
ncbi:MAG: O-succinylbenzoic acid--CoA ligase, partial [Crocinitomicaceae bacterium]|nr:O-succinylbenzoic acid--CoA ligase [Crocinitomicaceae bacterium]